jgi:hypothetical protein
MAFSFSVEDGSGVADATSYVSVQDADDILTVNIHAGPEWTAASNDDKERLLSWASRYLDERARWFGTKAVETSALRWPRSGVKDQDDIEISDDVIPRQLQIATAEMARYLLSDDRSVERDQDGLERLKADTIELEFADGYRLPAVPSHIGYLIKGLGTIGSGNGTTFARIIR